MTGDDVRELLQPFTDPATDFVLHDGSRQLLVSMIRDGRELKLVLPKDDASVLLQLPEERRFATIDSLLASSEFADLRALAATQLRMLARIADEPELKPEVVLDSSDGADRLREMLKTAPTAPVRLIVLDGPAGIGKTRFIERVTYDHAKIQLAGGNAPPVLVVSSRGRRLSSLRDVIAASIQIVRGKFTFEQVPALVKRGLLILAIDGFDELADTEGYADAWNALRDLVDDIHGRGTCVLAGRDTFFDEHGFMSRLDRPSETVEAHIAHILPVKPAAAREWLRSHEWSPSDVASPIAEELFQQNSYALRPFFLSILAPQRGWDSFGDQSAREFLIDRFIDRESGVVAGAVGIEKSVAVEILRTLFEELALDMAERESDSVDIEYVALLVETLFSSHMPSADIRKLTSRAGVIGLLERDSVERMRRFPHSEVRFHFLSRGIIREAASGHVPRALRRAVLGSEFLDILIEALDAFTGEDLTRAVVTFRSAAANEVSFDRLGENVELISFTIKVATGTGERDSFDGLTLTEVVLPAFCHRAKFVKAVLGQLDARTADASHLSFVDSQVSTVIVDASTRISASFPLPRALHVVDAHRPATYRNPKDIRDWIDAHRSGNAQAESERLPLIDFFHRVCRRALRQFYIKDDMADSAGALLSNPLWQELEPILQREDRLERTTKQMHGPRAALIHIKNPMALLDDAIEDAAATRIRSAVLQRAHELRESAVDR